MTMTPTDIASIAEKAEALGARASQSPRLSVLGYICEGLELAIASVAGGGVVLSIGDCRVELSESQFNVLVQMIRTWTV